jgi:integrase
MRKGEAFRLLWKDIDFERRTITLNDTEKGSNPRIFKVSNRLIARINILPRKNQRVFSSTTNRQTSFYNSRKRIAKKLQNPRLQQICFHTLRHWKATMLYHQTKDIQYVKQYLGHNKVETTLLYIQLAETIFKDLDDKFTVKVASKKDEITAVLEVGFEYICEKDELYYFRKRK